VVERVIVVPGAPVFLPGLSQQQPELVDAIARKAEVLLADLTQAQSASVAVVAAPPVFRDLNLAAAANPIRAQQSGAAEAALRGNPAPHIEPTGWAVTDHFLRRVGVSARVAFYTPSDAVEWDAVDVLIVAAGGSAAIGPKSPRVGTPGAELDDTLATVLSTGNFADLALVSDTQGAQVGCTDAATWRWLGSLTGTWQPTFFWQGAPFGATYFVAAYEATPMAFAHENREAITTVFD